MNTLADNVISFRPDDTQSQRWLALSLGNGARRAGAALDETDAASAAMMQSGRTLAELADGVDAQSGAFASLARKLEHCLDLSHQLARL